MSKNIEKIYMERNAKRASEIARNKKIDTATKKVLNALTCTKSYIPELHQYWFCLCMKSVTGKRAKYIIRTLQKSAFNMYLTHMGRIDDGGRYGITVFGTHNGALWHIDVFRRTGQ